MLGCAGLCPRLKCGRRDEAEGSRPTRGRHSTALFQVFCEGTAEGIYTWRGLTAVPLARTGARGLHKSVMSPWYAAPSVCRGLF